MDIKRADWADDVGLFSCSFLKWIAAKKMQKVPQVFARKPGPGCCRGCVA
jgi:hypothetical protein